LLKVDYLAVKGFQMNKTLVDFYKKFVVELSKYIKTKQILIVLSLLFLFAISKEYTFPILYNILGHEIFKKLESHKVADYCILFIVVLYININLSKRQHFSFHLRKNHLIYSIIIIVIYVFIRFCLFELEFLKFQLFKHVAYFDAFVLIGLFEFMFVKRTKVYELFKAPHNPIEYEEYDKLNFNHHAKSVANFINNLKYNDSFRIGIEGSWGYGKTSFISLLISNLENSKFIVVQLSALDDSIISGNRINFYKRLEQDLILKFKDNDALADALKKYFNLIGNYFGSEKDIFSKLFSNNNDATNLKDNIDSYLRSSNKKLLIVIDDLDRLIPTEVLNLFVFLRSLLNFENSIFIIAYDKEVIDQILSELKIPKSKNYLTKLIDLEVSPPKYSKNVLINELRELIKKNSDVDQKLLYEAVDEDITLVIGNLRDVYRFYYSFLINYNKVKGLVNLKDFIKLELIRFYFPSEHIRIYDEKDDLFETESNNEGTNFILKKSYAKEDDRYSTEVRILLNKVFSRDRSENDFSARIPSRFNLYFDYDAHDSLRNHDFTKARFSKEEKDLVNYCKNEIEGGRMENLFYTFSQTKNFESKGDFKAVLDSLFNSYCIYYKMEGSLPPLNSLDSILSRFLEDPSINYFYTDLEIIDLIFNIKDFHFSNFSASFLIKTAFIDSLFDRYMKESSLLEVLISNYSKVINKAGIVDYKCFLDFNLLYSNIVNRLMIVDKRSLPKLLSLFQDMVHLSYIRNLEYLLHENRIIVIHSFLVRIKYKDGENFLISLHKNFSWLSNPLLRVSFLELLERQRNKTYIEELTTIINLKYKDGTNSTFEGLDHRRVNKLIIDRIVDAE